MWGGMGRSRPRCEQERRDVAHPINGSRIMAGLSIVIRLSRLANLLLRLNTVTQGKTPTLRLMKWYITKLLPRRSLWGDSALKVNRGAVLLVECLVKPAVQEGRPDMDSDLNLWSCGIEAQPLSTLELSSVR